MIDRERRATDQRIKEAQFPVIKTLDRFNFKAPPAINEPLVRELLRGEYLAKKENRLLVGNPGTGKTHLACALGFGASSQGKRVRFYTTTGLVTQLLEAREERPLQRLQKQLERQDLLLLDELGYVPFSKAGAELLFDVVEQLVAASPMLFGIIPTASTEEALGQSFPAGQTIEQGAGTRLFRAAPAPARTARRCSRARGSPPPFAKRARAGRS